MRKIRRFLGTLGIAVLLTSVMAAPSQLGNGHGHHRRGVFQARLKGNHEVPPVESDGKGFALFVPSHKKKQIFYVLVTQRLEDITQAHIHMGPKDENGPVVAFLFNSHGQPVTRNGALAVGVLKAEDLVGPLDGEPLSALVTAMKRGNAYVNVHTVANPSGEIRGQIKHKGKRRHKPH